MVNIKVAVRIRPMSNREHCQHDTNIVTNADKCILVTNPKISEKCDGADSRQRTKRFAVDYCYDPNYPELSSQQAVFEEIGQEVVGHMMAGYNACVLAYGHSASGKTYTMMGDPESPGLTPRICTELSRRMLTLPHHHVSLSFLEIYNEKVRDLLLEEEADAAQGYSLRVREHPKLGPYVQGLSEHVVETEEDFLQLLDLGNRRRRTAVTESNASSSRSHAVFTIKFKQIGDVTAKYSKVHLVDLAGSERASAVQSRARMKEGANINKSLVTLGNVISALADSSGSTWVKSWQPFVPYRDSVLTWLLKDTLGGNSNTIMIATISPGSSCYNDTINTLRYAKRTKKIVNQPLVNEDPKVRTIRELRDEVARLKTMLLSYTSGAVTFEEESTETNETMTMAGADSSSKWPRNPITQCAVALQTDDMDLLYTRRAGALEMPHDLLGHLEGISSNAAGTDNGDGQEEWIGVINSATPDILPCSQHSPWSLVPTPHVSQINAGNAAGVNRVIADPVRVFESGRQKCASGAIVPRVTRQPFKRRRTLYRPNSVLWDMLHRSRPDLIKGIGGRQRASQVPPPGTDPLSQSTSENSLHSSGSTESRTKPGVGLSRTSSVDNGSGSSTPTQPSSRIIVRPRRENKRAEIVASVTSRLYEAKKKPDLRQEALLVAAKEKEEEDDDELDELNLCKRARMKLFDMSRKLALTKKVKRTVDSDTQTETQNSTLMVREKCVATEQQGVLRTLTCATNTPTDSDLHEPDPPVIVSQVVISAPGKYVVECKSSNISVDVPLIKCDSEMQTLPESKDQATSPKKTLDSGPVDDYYSDDSLEYEESACLRSFSKRNKQYLGRQFYSCQNLHQSTHVYPHYYSQPNIKILKQPVWESPQVPKFSIDAKVEKNLGQISRFNISGTNAFYEYDPNKSTPENVIFSNAGSSRLYGPGETPPVIYPTYDQQILNSSQYDSNDIVSSDDAISTSKYQNNSIEENLSSETSTGSLASSVGSTDSTSSDDFVFMETKLPSTTARELYTISENSEASCSSRSSPISVSHKDQEEIEQKIQPDEEKKRAETSKKVHWAEMECNQNNEFFNFNYTPSQLNRGKCESKESPFSSKDSITFVFLGGKQPETSVLMEIVKRSLLGGSDQLNCVTERKSRGVQCSGKLMRSVSVDTAMIALSRLSRQERCQLSRTASLSTVVSEETQVNLDNEPPLGCVESGVQCQLAEKIDKSCEILPTDCASQCDLEKTTNYSVGTSTCKDQETETEVERKEFTTQTDEELFDPDEPQLPRTTGSSSQGFTQSSSEDRKLLSKEIRNMILGKRQDLFPSYLAEEDCGPQKDPKSKRSTKTISWSDLTNKDDPKFRHQESDSSPAENTLPPHSPRRPHTLPRRRAPSPEVLKEFLKEATNILKDMQIEKLESSDTEQEAGIIENKIYSTSGLLRRRKRRLTRLKVGETSQNSNESSVQTDAEKIDRLVQTDGFAASLVGPPIRRSLTPNFKPTAMEENSVANLTWPRRRISAKPPPSPRINRTGSSASRVTVSSTNGSSSSHLHSPRRTRYSPRRDVSVNQIDQSCHRLQMAIALDRMRQRNLDDCLELYFSDESTNSLPRRAYSGRRPASSSELLQYESIPHTDSLSDSYNERLTGEARIETSRQFYCPERRRGSFEWSPRRDMSTPPRSYSYATSESSSDDYRHISERRSAKIRYPPIDNSRLIAKKAGSNTQCGCLCHMCGESSVDSPLHCHTCCVPCVSETGRPYSSEPFLHPSRRSSPLAHLRQLISVRRNIVLAEQVGCNK